MPVRVRCKLFDGSEVRHRYAYTEEHVKAIVSLTKRRPRIYVDHRDPLLDLGRVENLSAEGLEIHGDLIFNDAAWTLVKGSPRLRGLSISHSNRVSDIRSHAVWRPEDLPIGWMPPDYWLATVAVNAPYPGVGPISEVSLTPSPACPSARLRVRGGRFEP